MVTVEALPNKLPVIVPASKFPSAFLKTIVFGVLTVVAVVAEFATFPLVLIVNSLVSVISPKSFEFVTLFG